MKLPSTINGFDPTYGYSEATLRAVSRPDAPKDFEEFWRRTFEEASRVRARPIWRAAGEMNEARVFEVDFDGLPVEGIEPFRVGGWITLPREGPVTSGMVVSHGYGGRDVPGDAPMVPHTAVIYPCARGFGRSARRDLPSTSNGHVLYGIGSPATYIHRFCVADLWSAASALIELVPESANWMTFSGASFGGGIGALAMPWDRRFERAFLDFPSFGHHPIRLSLPSLGSSEAVRQNGGIAHLPTLRYFDAATAASFTQTPTFVAAALYDPAVPAPGQFAVYNCLAGEKQLFVRQAAHLEHPQLGLENERLNKSVIAWLSPPATGKPCT